MMHELLADEVKKRMKKSLNILKGLDSVGN